MTLNVRLGHICFVCVWACVLVIIKWGQLKLDFYIIIVFCGENVVFFSFLMIMNIL